MDEIYFANLETKEIGAELFNKVENFYDVLEKHGHLKIWRKSYKYYNNSIRLGGELNRAGEQNEYTTINVNHYRNILQHLLVLTVSQRPAFQARAANSDYRSQTQTILAQGLLDYYMREKRLERELRQATEYALMYGEGFVECVWDPNIGEIYGEHPETRALVREGDVRYKSYSANNVIRDLYNPDPNVDWVILRSLENRHDIIAQNEEYKDEISAASDDFRVNTRNISNTTLKNQSDLIPVYYFYHKPTPAIPDGRFVQFISDNVILFDGPLPYRGIPVFRIAPGNISGTPLGYSPAFDLLPLQEAVDAEHSTIITNHATFGIQNIAIPRGANINHMQLADGLNVIEYDEKGGKPEPMNLTHTPAEVFNYLNQLVGEMETISGVNSVARGNPEASLKSGAALALVQSMSIQFSQGLQQSYSQLVEDVGTATINLLRDFAQVPRVATIAGKTNRSYMKEFSGEDLSEINRVIVDFGNPLSKTTAGKVNLAEQLVQAGLIKRPEQYLQVVNTGTIDPLIEAETAELLLVRSENEEMAEGRYAIATIVDDHRLHIIEHRAVLASPEARTNPEVVSMVTAHIQEHIDLLKSADPNLLIIIGQEPLQAEQQIAQNEAGNIGEALDATNPLDKQAQSVKLPEMPVNPLSNNQWNPEDGGL